MRALAKHPVLCGWTVLTAKTFDDFFFFNFGVLAVHKDHQSPEGRSHIIRVMKGANEDHSTWSGSLAQGWPHLSCGLISAFLNASLHLQL